MPRRVALPGVSAALLLTGLLTGCQTHSAASEPSSDPSSSSSSSAAPARTASGGGAPTRADIKRVMAHTVEAANPSTHFAPAGIKATAPDGKGGRLTAVVGRRTPAADGNGQVVFFWHGRHFAGTDGDIETDAVRKIKGGRGHFTISYTRYAENDPACCSSLPPATVVYAWQDGEGFAPSGARPHHGDPVRIKLPG